MFGVDALHAALQVQQSGDGLLQTLPVVLVLAVLLQLLWKRRRSGRGTGTLSGGLIFLF